MIAVRTLSGLIVIVLCLHSICLSNCQTDWDTGSAKSFLFGKENNNPNELSSKEEDWPILRSYPLGFGFEWFARQWDSQQSSLSCMGLAWGSHHLLEWLVVLFYVYLVFSVFFKNKLPKTVKIMPAIVCLVNWTIIYFNIKRNWLYAFSFLLFLFLFSLLSNERHTQTVKNTPQSLLSSACRMRNRLRNVQNRLLFELHSTYYF